MAGELARGVSDWDGGINGRGNGVVYIEAGTKLMGEKIMDGSAKFPA
jgi:hypothetical protein